METTASTHPERCVGVALALAIALIALAPSSAPAAAEEFWEGKWKIRVEGGSPGFMCLKQQRDYVEGKFQSEDPGKFGEIWGDLTQRRQIWDGGYKDKGTGDKGGFHAEYIEGGSFSGSFKPREANRRYDWGGKQLDFDGGYRDCVKSL